MSAVHRVAAAPVPPSAHTPVPSQASPGVQSRVAVHFCPLLTMPGVRQIPEAQTRPPAQSAFTRHCPPFPAFPVELRPKQPNPTTKATTTTAARPLIGISLYERAARVYNARPWMS